jgi:hypothetical protein
MAVPSLPPTAVLVKKWAIQTNLYSAFLGSLRDALTNFLAGSIEKG